MGKASHISSWWKQHVSYIGDINNPAIAWETMLDEVYMVSAEVPNENPDLIIPATYSMRVYPLNQNHRGAKTADVQIGYKLLDYVGQIYEVVDVIDDRIIVSDILLSSYSPQSGRPAIVYNESSLSNQPKPKPFETRWVVVSKTCVLDEDLHNTGEQEVVSKKQQLNTKTNQWEDTGETTKTTVTNHSDCPPPAQDPYRIAVFAGLSDYEPSNATEVAFNAVVKVSNPTVSGFNYLFFSTPTAFGKPTILNSIGKDISYQFAQDVADNKVGYQPNTVWKRQSTFLTTVKTYFTLEL